MTNAIAHWRRLAFLLPALVAVLAAWTGWQFAGGLVFDVGARTDGSYLQGFYERETSTRNYRWSGPEAQITLPAVRPPVLISLALIGHPDGTVMDVALDGQPLAALEVQPHQTHRYHILWDGPVPASGHNTLTLSGTPLAQPDDPRELVALVDSVTLRSLPSTALPPALPLLLLAVLGGALYGLLRFSGAPLRVALLVALVSAAALGAGWGFARLWVAPHLIPITVGVLVLLGVFGALRYRTAQLATLREPALLACFATVTGLIPLYLFILYGWQAPVDWRNLPVLLLPLGLALLWLRGTAQRVALGLILVVAGGYAAGVLHHIFSGDYASDFHAMYRGVAGLVRHNAPLYQIEHIHDNPLGATYKYPPMFATFFAPLTHLPFVPAILTWRAINLFILIAAVLLLLRVYAVSLRSWAGAALVLMACTLRPLSDTLNYGQIDLILLLLLVAGLSALRRQQHTWLGVWIGIGTAIKIYPAFLLGFALLQRRWRALPGAALAVGLLSAASLLAFGWAIHWTFLREVFPATGVGTTWIENQTFNGFFNRLFSPQQVALLPEDNPLMRLLTYACALGLTALTAWLTRPDSGVRAETGYSLWIVTMLLILPAAWIHYQTLLLIPFFHAFILAREQREGLTWPFVAVLSLSWMVIVQGNQWTFFDRSLHGPFWQLLLSYKFYGMLLLYGAVAGLAFASRRAAVVENVAVPISRPVLHP